MLRQRIRQRLRGRQWLRRGFWQQRIAGNTQSYLLRRYATKHPDGHDHGVCLLPDDHYADSRPTRGGCLPVDRNGSCIVHLLLFWRYF